MPTSSSVSGPPGTARRRSASDVLPPASALIEIVAVVGAIFAADRLLPDARLLAIQPSLLWLPVLLASLHYGTVSGLLAAGIAIVSGVLLDLPEPDVGENHFAYLIRIWAEPMLWIAVAVLLGQFRLRQITERRELTDEVAEITAQRAALAEHATLLRARCERLERRLASHPERLDPDLVACLGQLAVERTSPAAAACRVLELMFPGAAASVMLEDADGVSLVTSIGWSEPTGWSRRLTVDHPLWSALTVDRRPVAVLQRAGERALAGEGVMAVPVLDRGVGRCVGLIKVERAEAAQVSEASIRTLEGVAAVLALALAQGDGARTRAADDGRASWQHDVDIAPMPSPQAAPSPFSSAPERVMGHMKAGAGRERG